MNSWIDECHEQVPAIHTMRSMRSSIMVLGQWTVWCAKDTLQTDKDELEFIVWLQIQMQYPHIRIYKFSAIRMSRFSAIRKCRFSEIRNADRSAGQQGRNKVCLQNSSDVIRRAYWHLCNHTSDGIVHGSTPNHVKGFYMVSEFRFPSKNPLKYHL